MGKNKGTQPGAIKATVKELKEQWKTLTDRLVREHNKLRQETSKAFGDLQERFKKIVLATGQQLAQTQANIQVHSEVIEMLDINVQAVAKMHLENYGRFEQIEVFLKRKQVEGSDLELTQEELTGIKERAKESYEATMVECFRQVREERAAAVEEQRKAAEQAKAAAEKSQEEAVEAKKEAENKEESEFAQKTLEEAESRNISTSVGGQGASIPADAEVFGG